MGARNLIECQREHVYLVKLNISVVSSCSDTVSHAMDSDVLVEITCSFCAISVSFLLALVKAIVDVFG